MKKKLKLHSWIKLMDDAQAKGMSRKKMDRAKGKQGEKKRRSKQYFYTSMQ
jgi:uncharacterized protein with von Willebrand factor type A (vWA) domain